MSVYAPSSYDYPPQDNSFNKSNSYEYDDVYSSPSQNREPSHYHLDDASSSVYQTPHSGRRHTWASPPPPKLSSSGDLVVYGDGGAPSSPVSAAGTDVSPYSSTEDYHYSQAIVPFDDNQRAMVVYNDQDGIKNPSALPEKIVKMKKNRRRATVGAGVVGGVVGLVALGPVGGVVGGVGAAVVTKHVGKRREKKKLQKMSDQEIARQHQNAPDVEVHSGEFL